MNEKIYLLDCTFRDGGYYTDWSFCSDTSRTYFNTLRSPLVDIVELGYKKNISSINGEYFYSNENFINSLNLCNDTKYSLMIDFVDLLNPNGNFINENLNPTLSDSLIKIIRLACNYEDLFNSKLSVFVNQLIDFGYDVCINIMKCSFLTHEMVLKSIDELNNLDLYALYFADSFGTMTNQMMLTLFADLNEHSSLNFGFHGHDNMGLAFSNSILALDLGFTFIDSTILGMGRGAGNTSTEMMCAYLNRFKNTETFVSYNMLETKYFLPLKKEYGWGYSYYYYTAAKNNIHPSYVQQMNNDLNYSSDEILTSLDKLKSNENRLFRSETLLNNFHFLKSSNSNNFLSNFQSSVNFNDTISIIGPMINQSKCEFELQFLKNNLDLTILATNSSMIQSKGLIDYRVACNPIRFFADYNNLINSSDTLLGPFQQLGFHNNTFNFKYFDLPIKFSESQAIANEDNFILNTLSVLIYSLHIAALFEVKKIFTYGFPGYKSDHHKTKLIDNLIVEFMMLYPNIEIVSLEPSLYSIDQTSVYSIIKS